MKNKDRYNLKDLKFRAIRDRRQDFKLPLRHWKIEIFKDGEHIETKYCEGGSITDLMAWLESDDGCWKIIHVQSINEIFQKRAYWLYKKSWKTKKST